MRKLLIVTALLLFVGIATTAIVFFLKRSKDSITTKSIVVLPFENEQTSKTPPIDIEAEIALNEIMDKIISAFKTQDRSIFLSFLTEDALFCGTDPTEFWNTQYLVDGSNETSTNPFPELKYIGDRRIKVAPGGKSAIVVTQFIVEWSPKIPLRQVFHFVKINDKWLIYFVNVAFIPNNEDIQRLNEAID